MITKESIRKGFKKGIISIEEEFSGCIGICCRIADFAFYFLGNKGGSLSLKEYWKSYPLDLTIDMIYNILKDAESAEVNGIFKEEYEYYETILSLV